MKLKQFNDEGKPQIQWLLDAGRFTFFERAQYKCLMPDFMSETFQKKSDTLKNTFAVFSTIEDRYKALIDMGRSLPPIPAQFKCKENLVAGCQSNLYLSSKFEHGLVFFEAASDALISAGLAAILIAVYSGESPETILKQPPQFLADLQIHASLSPNRSNGLAQIHLRMKQDALKFLVSSNTALEGQTSSNR